MNVLDFSENMQNYASSLIYLIAEVYSFNIINFFLFKKVFNSLGIRPRRLWGLPGIICAPFLHGSTEHFLMNAVPFFFISLMMIAILDWDLSFLCIETIALVSGFLTWIVGRPGIHLGASGVVTGMFGWVMYWTIYSPTFVNIAILAILFIYFGSIIMGIFPTHEGVSWEGHLMGLIAGTLCSKYPQIVDEYFQIQFTLLSWWEFLPIYVETILPFQ